MANKGFPSVRKIRTGDSLSAGNANKSARDLEARTNNLRTRLDALDNSEAILAWNAEVDPDVLEGQAVYWNNTNQRFEAALAGQTIDPATQLYVPTAASNCLGLLLRKVAANVGHVALSGIVAVPSLNNAIGEDIAAGRYYLSSVEPGKLTQQRPAMAAYVCTVLGQRSECEEVLYVYVSPQVRDAVYDHVHFRFSLHCLPAGTHVAPSPGDVHTITDPNDALPGWLPADHESFDGKAPNGAAFGYNLAQHVELSRVWPPLPIGAVAMLWDKGVNHVGATEIPLGPNGLAIVDANGIWWMSNCEGDVPWPTTYDTSSSYSQSSESLECPRTETMRVELIFQRQLFASDRTVVTSLTPATGAPLIFRNCDGDAAATGDLVADLLIEQLITANDAGGSLVFKELDGAYKFKRGRVVSGMKAGSDAVVLTSTISVLPDPDDPTSRIFQDVVTIDFDSGINRELTPQIVRLGDAVQRDFRGVPYVGFPEDRDSQIVARYEIPLTGIPTNPQVYIKATMFGTVNGTLPPLPLTFKVVPEPTAAAPEVSIPETATAVVFDAEVDVDAAKVVKVESAAFDVTAGDTLVVFLSRSAAAGYLGEVGVIKIVAVLSGGS